MVRKPSEEDFFDEDAETTRSAPRPAVILLTATLIAALVGAGWIVSMKVSSSDTAKPASEMEIWHSGMSPRIGGLIQTLEALPEASETADRDALCQQLTAQVEEIQQAQEVGPAPVPEIDRHLSAWVGAAGDLASACPEGVALRLANDRVYRQFGPFISTLSAILPPPAPPTSTPTPSAPTE
jgi:hypothetical protein